MNSTSVDNNDKRYSLAELAALIDAELQLADGLSARLSGKHTGKETVKEIAAKSISIDGIATLAAATESQISFLSNPRYRSQLQDTRAAAVIIDSASALDCPVHCLVHNNPYLAFAKLSHYFDRRPVVDNRIHPTAVIDSSASIAEGASIGAGVVIAAAVTIGKNAILGANCVIEAGVSIGDNVCLMPSVVLYHAVRLGNNVMIHSGTVIGSDGFGYSPNPQTVDNYKGGYSWQKIAQLGSVSIGDRVEIGANTTVDRGALDDTIIEEDVIIDNQVQIAHNVIIGRGTAIAGCVGIAGSATIGKFCNIGGGSGIAGHLTIADRTSVLGMTLINRSVTQAGTYASGTGMQDAVSWRKSAVRFTQLDSLNQRVKALEKSADK